MVVGAGRAAGTGRVRHPSWRAWARSWAVVAVALLLAALGRAGDAHPHVFVDYTTVLVLGVDGAPLVQMTWTFDEMSSSMLLDDIGAKRRTPVGDPDITALVLKQYPDLRGERFFLDVRVDGAPVRVPAVRDFRARVEGERVSYSFTVPIGVRSSREGTIEIRVDDPSYFVAFEPRQDVAPRFSAPPSYVVACRVVPGEGSYDAPAIRCTYRRKAA